MKLNNLNDIQLAEMVARDQDLKLEIYGNMKKYAGSFVKCLAECLLTADPTNLRLLVVTFSMYVREYLPEKWLPK